MNVIVDTSEKKPLTFEGYKGVCIYRENLDYGDYSVTAHDRPNDDDSIIFERKENCLELCGNLGTNWERFEKVLDGMAYYCHKAIVVCGPNNFTYLYDQKLTKLHPNFTSSRLAYILYRYNIPTLFFPNRGEAEQYMFRYFYNIIKND